MHFASRRVTLGCARRAWALEHRQRAPREGSWRGDNYVDAERAGRFRAGPGARARARSCSRCIARAFDARTTRRRTSRRSGERLKDDAQRAAKPHPPGPLGRARRRGGRFSFPGVGCSRRVATRRAVFDITSWSHEEPVYEFEGILCVHERHARRRRSRSHVLKREHDHHAQRRARARPRHGVTSSCTHQSAR